MWMLQGRVWYEVWLLEIAADGKRLALVQVNGHLSQFVAGQTMKESLTTGNYHEIGLS